MDRTHFICMILWYLSFFLIFPVNTENQNFQRDTCPINIPVVCLNLRFDLEDYFLETHCIGTLSCELIINDVYADCKATTDKHQPSFTKKLWHENPILVPEYLIQSSEEPIEIHLPQFLHGHPINHSCLMNLDGAPINKNVMNVSLHYENSRPRISFSYSASMMELIKECYNQNDAIVDLSELDQHVYYHNKNSGRLYMSEMYVLKLSDKSPQTILQLEEMCEISGFTHCQLMKDTLPYYFIRDPDSRKKNSIDSNIKSKRIKSKYIRNIHYCLPETTSLVNEKILHWTRKTPLHSRRTSLEPCLNDEGRRIERMCMGNLATGAYWEDPPEYCSQAKPSTEDPSQSINNKLLYCAAEERNGLNWNTTLLNTITTPVELCVDDKGKLVTRWCNGNTSSFPIWSDPSGVCSTTFKIPEITRRLHYLLNNGRISEVFAEIAIQAENITQLTADDLHFLSEALKHLTMDKHILSQQNNFLRIVNNIMQIDPEILKDSQIRLNATDKILGSIENFIIKIADQTSDSTFEQYSNIVIHAIYPLRNNITGLALYKILSDNSASNNVISVDVKDTFDKIPMENLELATYLLKDYLHNLTNEWSDHRKSKFKVIYTVFLNNRLFNEINYSNRSVTKNIVHVYTSDHINVQISVIFNMHSTSQKSNCLTWNYGQRKFGNWSDINGSETEILQNSLYIECTIKRMEYSAILDNNEKPNFLMLMFLVSVLILTAILFTCCYEFRENWWNRRLYSRANNK